MRAALLVTLLLAPRFAVAQAAEDAPPAAAFGEPAPSAVAEPPAAAAPSAPAPAVEPPAVAAPAAPAPVPAAPAAAPAQAPKKHSGGYFGFSFGTGRGEVMSGSTTTSVDDLVPGVKPTTLALMLRFGWASGDLLFGLQLNLVRSQWDVSGASSAMQIAAFDFVTTLRDPGTGLYARVGVGPAQLTFEANGTQSQTWNGTEAMLGAGITLGNLGVGFDYVRQAYGNDAPMDGAGYYLATISLDFD